MISEIGSEENCFDFNKIIPIPNYVFNGGPIGDAERKKYGKNNWYDWCCEHWGTKWNSYDSDMIIQRTYSVKFMFFTAWFFPRPIFKQLKKHYKDIIIHVKYSFEEHEDKFFTEVF